MVEDCITNDHIKHYTNQRQVCNKKKIYRETNISEWKLADQDFDDGKKLNYNKDQSKIRLKSRYKACPVHSMVK